MSYNLQSYDLGLDDASITGFSFSWWDPPHLVQPLEIRLVFTLLQHPVHGLLEYKIHCLCIILGCLSEKLLPQLVGAERIRSRVSLLRHEDLRFSFTLRLVIFHPFVILYSVHYLVHTLSRLHGKGFS